MARFFTVVHDVADCAFASIYCDESKAGPAEVVVVIPAGRRFRLRENFAFELVTFARFLGSLNAEAVLPVHEAIEAALAQEDDSSDVVLSISSGLWSSDQDPALSRCVEKLAVTVLQWLNESAVES